jgi:hypothetical protein
MDRQSYLRRLRARTEHIEGALRRAMGTETSGQQHVGELRRHADRIESAGDDAWHDARDDVERTISDLHGDVQADDTLHEVAESVKDGAVELFRGETPTILERLKKKPG